MNIITLIMLLYIIGIIFFIIYMALELQESYFEEKGIFRSLSSIIYAILSTPSWLLLLSWFGLLVDFKKNTKK